MTTSDPHLLIALPPVWLDQFVGPDALARLRDRFANVTTHVVAGNTPEARAAWQAEVLRLRPTAVLSGWGTPAIPPEAMPPLKIVAHTAGSVRGLVTREMIERGLIATNWGDAAAPAVAECALLLTLACLRRLHAWTNVMHRERGWVAKAMDDDGIGLYGRRVSVHGFGNIARRFLKLIAPFGCDVTVYSDGVPPSVYAEHGVRAASSLAALFDNAEVVVDVEALNDRTRGSVTEPLLRSIVDGGVFVNVGRGAVVDQRALERVAAEGRLNVGLDVYDREPLPADSPLRGLSNVILLPHIAGPTRDQRRACGARAIEALCAFTEGRPIERPVTPDEYDRST